MPEIALQLEDRREAWEPGALLSGSFTLDHSGEWIAEYVDLVVWWSTTGKGDQDTGIVHRESFAEKGKNMPPIRSGTFRVKLHRAPWTYHGKLIKIDWYVGLYACEQGKEEDSLMIPIRVFPGAAEVPRAPTSEPPKDFLPDAPPLE